MVLVAWLGGLELVCDSSACAINSSMALGLPRIGFHGLPHSYATAALRAGVSPEVLCTRLGHSSVVITLSMYAHVLEQDDQAATYRVATLILEGA